MPVIVAVGAAVASGVAGGMAFTAVSGAVAGAIGGGLLSAVAGVVAGAVVGAVVGGVISAAGAVIMGDDVGDALKRGIITGALSGGIGAIAQGFSSDWGAGAAKSSISSDAIPSNGADPTAAQSMSATGEPMLDPVNIRNAATNPENAAARVAADKASGTYAKSMAAQPPGATVPNAADQAIAPQTVDTSAVTSQETGLFSKAGKLWNGMSDEAQGAVIEGTLKAGGQVLSGIGEQKAAEEQAIRQQQIVDSNRARMSSFGENTDLRRFAIAPLSFQSKYSDIGAVA